MFGGAGINTDHSKYSGSGFVDNMTTQGSGVTFTVNAAQAGPQPVHLRYANGPNPSVKTKVVSLLVNGTEVDPLSFPAPSTGRRGRGRRAPLDLKAGSNTITLRYDAGDDGWVNVDVLKVGAERDICTPQVPGTGYTSLFDGTLDSLAGWRQASAGSFARQADCSLKTVGNAGMLWWPGERFDKYSLKLDWMMAGDDNSGVFVGFPDTGQRRKRDHRRRGDPDRPDGRPGTHHRLDLRQQAADAAARDAALKPAGQWNAYEIIVQGGPDQGVPQRRQDQRLGRQSGKTLGSAASACRCTAPATTCTSATCGVRKLDQVVGPEPVVQEATVSGSVPSALGLTLSASASLGSFTPGVTRDYTATLNGTVLSTEPAAQLSVHDPSATATGRLVNGTWALPQPLQLRTGSAAFAPLSTTGAPLALAGFNAPMGKRPVTIDVKQAIAETDSLRAGSYGKTLVFSLSATTP